MARKSNKTAHVLNLLAGHDAAKEADEQASIEQGASGGPAAQTPSGGAAVQAAQNDAASGGVSQESSDEEAPQAVSGSESPQAAPGSAASQRASGRQAVGQARSAGASGSANAGQTVAPVPIPVAPAPNNIAVIDKTGEDPVAELIQQKLSSEFEKQMQQSQEEISPTGDVKSAQKAAAVSAGHPDSLPLGDAEEIFEDIHMEELLLSDAESIVLEQDHDSAVKEANAGAIILDEDTAEAFDDLSEEDSFPVQEDESLTILEAEPIAEEDLAIEPAAAVPAPTPEPEAQAELEPELQAESEPEPQAEPVSELQAEPEPETQAGSEPELQAEQAESVSELQTEPESDFAAINVMEHIVRDKIIYFMRQFDVCTCDRCKADVTALTLNGLMPKYIVTMKAAVDPLLSYYTNRLISDVTVEATKSCMIVKENPRH